MQSAAKENSFVYMRTLSESVSERCQWGEDSAHRARELFLPLYMSWMVKYHTCMCQNACLYKYPRKHSHLGVKWKQTAEKENTSVTVYCIQAALKVTAVYYIPAICKQQKTENLSLLLTKSLLQL